MIGLRYTIFIPSYNGGTFLRECVASILGQTYDEFELIVLDDGSTDGSMEWLNDEAQHDHRIRILASNHLGIEDNWRRTLSVPKNEFMTILAQDDLLQKNYLHSMNDLIDSHPDATLYHAHFRYVDDKGSTLRFCRLLPERETTDQYMTELFNGRRDTHAAGYLWRSKDYDAVDGILPWPGLLFADDALWISLMRRGYKATSPKEGFVVRRHAASASASPPWQRWLASLQQYIPFLQETARYDEAFGRAYQECAPQYFLNWCLNIYKLALMQATQDNKSVAFDEVFMEICAALDKVEPEWTPNWKHVYRSSRGLRTREWVNAHAVTRALYNSSLKWRPHKI